MPIEHAGIRVEHLAARNAAGVFDVSHMGQIESSGPDALAFLRSIVSNDVAKIGTRGARYSVLRARTGA